MIELDIHTHLAPINPSALAALNGVQWHAQDEVLVLDGHRLGVKDLFHVSRLLKRMDKHEVRRALVSIPPPLYRQNLSREDALAWARYVNEELLAIAAAHSDRLGAMFYIPLEFPSLFEDLQADFNNGDWEGVALAAGGHSNIVYSNPQYEPLWQWLDSKGVFAFMHPGKCEDTRLDPFYLNNLVGNPMETGVAAAHLVMAGVPSRYPDIRFCLAHAGGTFPTLVGRMQRGLVTSRPGINLEIEPPLQAAERFFVDCIAHHPGALELAKDVFGSSHILYGSDWPFPMGLDGSKAAATF
jgi:aminocarboxymuconate-semialdehyde decarboxylase